jgi:hydrogenase nickel incorporation protein HypA/HybF
MEGRMHELAIAQSIVSMAHEVAAGRNVRCIRMEIGTGSCVSPDSLRFCFDLVAEGSCAAGAVLQIARPNGDGLNVKTMELEEVA